MKINKRKKSKDKQSEDKLKLHDSAPVIEAEDDELFLEELFANEEKASAVTIPEPKARSVEAHDVKKAKKASAERDEIQGDFLSSDEIDEFFESFSNKEKAEAVVKAEAEAEDEDVPEVEAEPFVEDEPEALIEAEPFIEDEPEALIEAEPFIEDEPEALIEADTEAEAVIEAEPFVEVGSEPQAEAELIEERPMSFDESLDSFTAEDTCSGKAPPSKKLDFIRLGVLAVCVCVFVYSTSYLITNIKEKYKSDLIYDEINNAIDFNIPGITEGEGGIVSLLAPDSPGAMTPTMDEIIKNGAVDIVSPDSHAAELAIVRASLEHLKNINDDLYGYIKVPGTSISYPIAQHESDNDYYLDRAYNGEHLVNGSIFADVRCNRDVMWNYNTVLYGHNVTSGSMFNHVNMFFEKDFFDNTLIYLYTFDGIFIYKPFSIHEAEYDSGYIATSFAETDHFVMFADQMRELSDVKSDATFTAESRMLTLSTCTNGIHTRRYALHAYLVESITD